MEVQKKFPQADLLKEKTLRLVEVNHLLDMGQKEDIKEEKNPLLEEAKEELIHFLNKEYDEAHNVEDFDTMFPDLTDIGLAYTTTPDEKHEIQFELNLVDYTATQYVDDKPISHYDYLKENGSVEKALDVMKFEMENAEFRFFVEIDEAELETIGLYMDDEGNFYDPLAKDLDNDGIIDRYDNDFRDSDYFESTYDVEDNLHTKEETSQRTEDKPFILRQIRAYQSESKTEEKQITKEQEYAR